jgi:hypothetical protein
MPQRKSIAHCCACALREAGVEPGARLAVVGNDMNMAWARLARVSVVAEVTPRDARDFWMLPPAAQHEMLELLEDGSRIVLARHVPDGANVDDWRPLGGTGALSLVPAA